MDRLAAEPRVPPRVGIGAAAVVEAGDSRVDRGGGVGIVGPAEPILCRFQRSGRRLSRVGRQQQAREIAGDRTFLHLINDQIRS